MSRRAGLQLDADAALGRHPRHAQGWRDQLEHDDSLDAPRGIVLALVWSLVAWACLGIVAWLAMAAF
jgi:uncharacterized membrane protein YbhN (UPF0104 family)